MGEPTVSCIFTVFIFQLANHVSLATRLTPSSAELGTQHLSDHSNFWGSSPLFIFQCFFSVSISLLMAIPVFRHPPFCSLVVCHPLILLIQPPKSTLSSSFPFLASYCPLTPTAYSIAIVSGRSPILGQILDTLEVSWFNSFSITFIPPWPFSLVLHLAWL